MKKRITIVLDDNQERELEIIMEEDSQTNMTSYFIYLIMQEKKRRAGELTEAKRPVGRPKKVPEVEDTNKYPPPYKGGVPYSKEDWELYWHYRPKQETPPLPKPLTVEELKKWD